MSTNPGISCQDCRQSRSELAGNYHTMIRCALYLYQSCRVVRSALGSCGPEAAHFEPRKRSPHAPDRSPPGTAAPV